MSHINVLFLLCIISSFLFIYVNTLRFPQHFKLKRSSLSNAGTSNAVGGTLMGIVSGPAQSSLFTNPSPNKYPSPLTQTPSSPFIAVKKEEKRLADIRKAKLAAQQALMKNSSSNLTNSKSNITNTNFTTNTANTTNTNFTTNTANTTNTNSTTNTANTTNTNSTTNNINSSNTNLSNSSSLSTGKSIAMRSSRVSTNIPPPPSPIQTSSNINVCYKDPHLPFSSPQTNEMKQLSLIVLIVFGTIYLVFRYIFSFKKKISDNFILSMIKVLSQQLIVYFFLVGLILLFYTTGFLDDYNLNWQFIISAFCIFGICWFFFCMAVIILSNFTVLYWRRVEKSSKDLKKLKNAYDDKANEQYISGKVVPQKEFGIVFEEYEYNILKTYFCNPFYPVFKASNLRKDFNFALYLEYCLTDKIRLFVKLSWSCWLLAIICIMLWEIFIVNSEITFNMWFLIFMPSGGILVSFLMHLYIKSIYRNVVVEVDKNNYMDFIDITANDFGMMRRIKIIDYPKYLDNVLRQVASDSKTDSIDVSQFNFNKLYHSRPPSIYEDLILFGTTGLFLMINVVQMIGFMFIIWGMLFFFREYNVVKSQGNLLAYLFIILLIFYLCVFAYILTINLKWYTIISSIEMKRDENRIKKVIHQQLFQASQISEKIYSCFKRLYFDIRLNEKKTGKISSLIPGDTDMGLTKNYLVDLVKIAIKRFKNIPKRTVIEGTKIDILTKYEDYPFQINEELRPFLKSCGNDLTNSEIEHLLHFIEKIEESEFSNITCNEIYDLHTMTIFFSNNMPQKIITYVLDKFFEEENSMLTSKMVEQFMKDCKYFNEDQINFVKEECVFMDKEFSKDALIHMLLSLRRYHPY